MRIVVFGLALLLSWPLLLAGGAGLLLGQMPAGRLEAMEIVAKKQLSQLAQKRKLPRAESRALAKRTELVFRTLPRAMVYGSLLGAGLVLLVLGVRVGGAAGHRPRPRRGRAPAPREREAAPARSRAQLKRHRKTVAEIEAKDGPEAAGDFLLSQNMYDEAADLFQQHGMLESAAQVRHDQNHFEEAADLYKQAGNHEAAGPIYAQLERFEEAAQCYVDAGKCSIAGELFERAGNMREAGRCYKEIGFHRHAAQAFLKAGAEGSAADSLVAAFEDEGGGGKLDDNKEKELRALATKAGELLAKLERFEEAEAILVRAGAFARAAKVAFQTGAYDRASELFLRIGRGDLAAKALERGHDEIGAARVLGEYLRDKGRDDEAVVQFEKAGEHSSAADLYRKLELYEKSGECYTKAEMFDAAAEMFHAGGCLALAGDAFERCHRFEEAAGCFHEAGDPVREAQAFEKGDQPLAAGRIFVEQRKLDEAIRVLQLVGQDDPGFMNASSLLGQVFQEKGMHTLSIKKLEEATGTEPVSRENVAAYASLAKGLDDQGEFERAIEIYERVLGFDYHYEGVAADLERAKSRQRQHAASEDAKIDTHGGASSRYELIRELGRGGMGVVHLARDNVLEREVAYKVMTESLRGNANALKSFLREAKAAAQLNHPNIVTVYDAGESDLGFYLAMEYIDGTTLKQIVERRGAIVPAGAVAIMRQTADALAYAHSKRVIHRDVKTANTMWARDKKVKIMDFGLAKLMEEVRNATTLVSGTPFYMSPEQSLGTNIDHRTDIYSLGVMMFELATGELPFRKGNVPYHHVHTPAPDPREIKPDLPEGLAKIILRCMEKDPDDRFQTADEISRVLPR